jgi:hypothetical protein
MDFTSCNYNYSLYDFTTHKQESCLGLFDFSELLVVNLLSWTLREPPWTVNCKLNWSLSLSFILRPTVSRPVYLGAKLIWGLRLDIYLSLTITALFLWASSLTRGRVWLSYMLLALASIVFLGSESLWTRNHILLSHIRDFPFRRLLRLAGSRWRYSNPPPHRVWTETDCNFSLVISRRTE